jgi:hypothetical protein
MAVVQEVMQPGMTISYLARRHGIYMDASRCTDTLKKSFARGGCYTTLSYDSSCSWNEGTIFRHTARAVDRHKSVRQSLHEAHNGPFPFGINLRGVIVGQYFGEDSVSHGFRRDANGSIHKFDVPRAGYQTLPISINAWGPIAGYASDPNFVVQLRCLINGQRSHAHHRTGIACQYAPLRAALLRAPASNDPRA